jgi:L-amino acid N-acyltransferase YncA
VEQDVVIRRAQAMDAGRIGEIYDEGIATGVATFATGPHGITERRRWLAARGGRAPVFVATIDREVRAWSALAPFSGREWYEGVAEYTVYVSAAARGAGLGARMLEHLIDQAPVFDYWKLVGMILPENAAGLALAERAGFRRVGTYEAHGRIDGRWRDVVLLERHLER